jgi:thiol:disulfide interchange protein DsbC
MCLRLAAVALLSLATVASAASPAEEARGRLAELLSRRGGGRPVEITSFEPTGLDGVYQAVLVGGDAAPSVAYFAPARDWLFTGELWALQEGQNLTQPVREEAQAARLRPLVAALPLDQAIRIGSGPRTVVEITDPDCPYCRRIAPFFEARADVTRYVFIAPLAHPQAARKVAFILQASNPGKALERAMAGGLDAPEALEGFKPLAAVEAQARRHLEVAKTLGVRGTPWFFVDGRVAVNGADVAALTRALDAPPARAAGEKAGPAKGP